MTTMTTYQPNQPSSPETTSQTKHTTFEDITAENIRDLTALSQLLQPNPAPIVTATFKKTSSDFQVSEVLDLELSGKGEHLWVLVKKTGMNTAYVADYLAKWANIPSRDVGYSGLKDRQAVTTQWFSLRIPKGELPESHFTDFITPHSGYENKKSVERVEVLKQVWHSKKLNRGTHKANHFVITLRDIKFVSNGKSVDTNGREAVTNTLNTIREKGVPNYFGSQRFGRQGNNIVTALEWFEQGTINGRKPHPKKSRDIQSLLLSSARSAIFNQILARRVADNSWDTGVDGEVFNLDGSGSVFISDQLDDTLKERVIANDIHPTAPLWGIKNDKVSGTAKMIETEVVEANLILRRLATGLEAKQIKTMRRALRLPITNLQGTWRDETTLVLDFTLPTGTFATSVLATLVQQLDG